MIGAKKETVSAGIPIFQRVIETAQGGFTLDEEILAAGTTIKSGTVVSFDETTRLAKIAKVAVLTDSATDSATSYKVKKGHYLVIGQDIALGNGTAQTITAIDTSNANYDLVTVDTTLGVAGAVGDHVFVDDEGADAPKGLLYNDIDVPDTDDPEQELAVVIRGTVYENRIPPVSTAIKALIPNIIFSKSY